MLIFFQPAREGVQYSFYSSLMAQSLFLQALEHFPFVEPGDDISALLLDSASRNELVLQDNDVLVIAQKIISKAENRYAYLNQVVPTGEATQLAEACAKDPKLTELILRESREVVRQREGVVIVEHKRGYVHANAGIDQSNISSESDNPRVLLLPENADSSAEKIRNQVYKQTGAKVAVIINDSAGRAWRNGTCGFAIGTAGFAPVEDKVGRKDLFDRPLETTQVAVADELAAAASFLMGQADEGLPVVLVRGANLQPENTGSETLIRPKHLDLFR